MASNFKKDLAKAKIGERTVLEVLRNTTDEWYFSDVSDDASCYYKGDIEAWDIIQGSFFIDVKMDSRIADTGNVLCEHKVYSYNKNEYLKGNMQSDYDALAVISVTAQKIWIIDFDVLKKHYKEGKHYVKDHYDDYGNLAQKTIGTLCSLEKIKKWGGLLCSIEYDDNNKPTRIDKTA
jgi:hypothetical protein